MKTSPVSSRQVDALLQQHRIVVCTGAGGVGKTTTAAALGLRGAFLGLSTLIVTIDPAKRLAQALGEQSLSAVPKPVSREFFVRAKFVPRAPVHLMMLDMQEAWSDLVRRLCGRDDSARELLANRFYQALSRDLPGSHEFIAAEALYTLYEKRRFDLIVLDTPPTAHALDFLAAPERVAGLLTNRAFRAFVRGSGSLSNKFSKDLPGLIGPLAQRFVDRFVGRPFLRELTQFMCLARDLYDPLVQRTQAFENLLHGDQTRFVIVLSTAARAMAEAKELVTRLRQRQFPFGLFVLNNAAVLPLSLCNKKKSCVDIHRLLHACDLSQLARTRLADVLDKVVCQECVRFHRQRQVIAQLHSIGHCGALLPRVSMYQNVSESKESGRANPLWELAQGFQDVDPER